MFAIIFMLKRYIMHLYNTLCYNTDILYVISNDTIVMIVHIYTSVNHMAVRFSVNNTRSVLAFIYRIII